MKRIARSAIVEHSAQQMYALVEDIESYPRFLPWCLEARVLERRGATTRARLTLGVRGLRQALTTRNENRADEGIDLHLEQGPFRRFAGAWRFDRLAAHACRIEFRLEYQFASRTLGRLLEPLFDTIADTMVDAFSRRAREIYGRDQG